MSIDWASLADMATDGSEYATQQAKRRAAIQAALALRAQQQAAALATCDAPVAPCKPSTVASSNVSALATSNVAEQPRDPVAVLGAALDAAVDDAARATLLAAAPPKVREQLWARSTYYKFMADTAASVAADLRAFAALDAALSAAPDDAARRVILSAADPHFVAKWREHRTTTEDSARRRYLALDAD